MYLAQEVEEVQYCVLVEMVGQGLCQGVCLAGVVSESRQMEVVHQMMMEFRRPLMESLVVLVEVEDLVFRPLLSLLLIC